MPIRWAGSAVSLLLALLVVAGLTALPHMSIAAAELPELPKCEEPVLITPAGQGPGGAIISVLCKRCKIDCREYPKAETGHLADAKTLVVVLGSSLKGLGAAGISIDQELARVKSLVNAAKERGVFVLGIHTEGEARRGGNCERVINEVIPLLDYLLLRSDGNKDGRFDLITEEHKVPMVVVDETAEIGDLLKEIFRKE
jgi:hypothetical protein